MAATSSILHVMSNFFPSQIPLKYTFLYPHLLCFVAKLAQFNLTFCTVERIKSKDIVHAHKPLKPVSEHMVLNHILTFFTPLLHISYTYTKSHQTLAIGRKQDPRTMK